METRHDSGWKWPELDLIDPEAGPEARTQRDALKLLAAFVQHTDSKAAQQQLVCPPGTLSDGCAAVLNGTTSGSPSAAQLINLNHWRRQPGSLGGTSVWNVRRCVARL